MNLFRSLLPFCLLFSFYMNAQTLNGTYRFVKDSDGKSARSGADITITFSNGTFKFKAVQPGETVEDAGTWKATGVTMTITFKEMAQGKQTGTWSLNNGALVLPFKMLSDGAGSSTWQDVNVAIIPQGTVMEVINRNMEGVKKITQYINKVDEWSKADEKKYKGGLAESYYVKANLFYFKRFKPEALYAFAKAAQLKPTNALYLNNLAEVIMDYGKYADAVILLKEVTRNFPNLDNPFGNLAVAQYNLGNTKGADSAIRVARRLNPKSGLYCYTDGKIKEKKGDKTGAQKDFEEAWSLGYGGSGREGAKSANANDAGKNGINATPVKPNANKNNKNNQNKTKGEQDREKIALWEGHYEASVVSARSGETPAEANTTFGKDLASTNIGLKTLACAKEFSMDISKSGIINGTGKIMYVYQGTASGPVAGMTPGPLAAQANNFGANLKDGFQIRDWSFNGEVDADGNVTINGMPTEQLDLLNVGKWQKIKPWSAFPPDAAGAAMKGPFHMKIVDDEKKGPVIYVNQYVELGDALIKKVHYRAYIYRSTSDVTPDCATLGVDPTPKCAASEFIKTKVAFSPHENISVEQSTTYSKGADGKVQASEEMAVNVVSDREIGILKQGMELHADGSFEMTVGIGVGTESFFEHSPVKLGERLDLVYDSKCGWGVKASATAEAGGFGTKTGASVEGVIFFNKAM